MTKRRKKKKKKKGCRAEQEGGGRRGKCRADCVRPGPKRLRHSARRQTWAVKVARGEWKKKTHVITTAACLMMLALAQQG